MKNKYIDQNVERLDIPVSEIDILKENNITTLGDLCNLTKTDLKYFNIKSVSIEKIQEELKLLGLALKKSI